jgi:hypothetical protein
MKRREVHYKKVVDPTNILLAFLFGLAALVFVLAYTITFDPNQQYTLEITILTIAIYLIILIFLLNPKIVKRISETEIKEIGVPVPIIETITETIEKPVFRDVIKTVEKKVIEKVFIEKPKKKPIPRKTFKYIGTSESMTYHKASCRFSKLIKKKYQVKENDKKYFRLRGYKKCKYCKP